MTETCARCGLFHPAGAACLALSVPPPPGWDSPMVGTLLAGRYQLLQVIHRGGMSVLYLANDAFLPGQYVVLKELSFPDDTPLEERREAESWFARESYLLSSLRNPLIPRFYSVFQEAGRSYIVQEYVAGENLDQVIRTRGPVPEDMVISWGIALCDLLTYLHEQVEPVIFRDLKPTNILWRADGPRTATWEASLAVVDFGIARPLREGVVGTVIGTPGYAPPEQYQGLASPRSDVYSLGATLHRLLTGYDPEQGPAFTFPPVRQFDPRLSPELAAVVERALWLDPAGRFESARVMGMSLRKLAASRGRGLMPVQSAALARRRSFHGGAAWVGPLIGTALIGSMLFSMASSFFRDNSGGTTTMFVQQAQPLNQGASGFAQDWASVPGDNGFGAYFQDGSGTGDSGIYYYYQPRHHFGHYGGGYGGGDYGDGGYSGAP
jgi:hypothetical protein